MNRAHAFAVFLALAGATTAQAVLRVGPARPFASIQPAIDAAQPGDVILIDAGSYASFTLTKDVTLRADPPGANVGAPWFATTPGIPGVIEGITFSVQISVSGTVLSLHGCTFTSGFAARDAAVHMTRCTLRSGVGGFSAQAAFDALGTTRLSAVQSSFSGVAASAVEPDGIRAQQQSRLHLNGCTVAGGQLAIHSSTGGDGIAFQDTATGWLADCTVTAGFGSPAGLAISSTSTASQVVVDRCTLNGSSNGFFIRNGLLAGISSASVLAVGAPFVLDVRTRPGFPVGFHATFALAAPASSPLLAQPEWGFLAATTFLGSAVADATGLASATIQVPNNASLTHLRVWFCAWSGVAFPLQLTTPLGGIVR